MIQISVGWKNTSRKISSGPRHVGFWYPNDNSLKRFKHSQRLKIYMAKLAQVKIFLDKLVHTSLKRTHFSKWFKSLWVGKIRLVKFHPDPCIFRVVKFHAFDNLVLYSVADLEAPEKVSLDGVVEKGGGEAPPHYKSVKMTVPWKGWKFTTVEKWHD